MREKIDLTPGWRRLTMVEAVKEYVGIDFDAITDDAEAVAAAVAAGDAVAGTAGQARSAAAAPSGGRPPRQAFAA